MISIKDFKVGDTVYILKIYRNGEKLVKAQVTNIGRKYVTAVEVEGYAWKTKFCVDYSPYMLVEKTEYSSTRFLFATEQQYRDFKEIKKLENWISDRIYSIRNRFSLEQLKTIKEILENPMEEEE